MLPKSRSWLMPDVRNIKATAKRIKSGSSLAGLLAFFLSFIANIRKIPEPFQKALRSENELCSFCHIEPFAKLTVLRRQLLS